MIATSKLFVGGGVSNPGPEMPPLDSSAAECRELIGRVVKSRELSRSLRLRELLSFLGERMLKPEAGILREQEIGAAVFGRPEDYDTNLDNIVRVNVSELRKRLAHYFLEEGATETIVMEIPRGGYAPVFSPRAAAAKNEPERDQPEREVLTFPEGEVRRRKSIVPSMLALTLVIALAGCAVLGWQSYRLRTQIQPWKSEPVRSALWSEFFASGDDVDIVTADTSFALAQDLLGRPISLDDYLDYKYKSLADDPSLSPDKRADLKLVLNRNNGSIGDFQAAKLFMDLDAHSPAVKLAGARSYLPESIKMNNVILIGSRESNPWVELYRSRLNFFVEYEPAKQRSYVVNRTPMPGEKSVYDASESQSRIFSVVAFLPNLNRRRFALIISGSDSQATRAAGEFVTSSEGLAQIRQKMPEGRFPFFEVVLATSRLVGTTVNTEIVAYRVYSR